ncbi:MAG: glycosyltransferase family 4 protein [Halobacteriales archaeon]|nr:glycosyltransferase family 4 protein [Halobacteriales archaeon]
MSAILVAHPRVGRGGSEAVLAALLEALQEDHELTVLTAARLDVAELGAFYGVALRAGRIAVEDVSERLLRGGRPAGLHGAWFAREVRRRGPGFDLPVSAYNPMDLGAPGVQLVADFSWDDALRRDLDPPRGLARAWYGSTPVRRAYEAACRGIAGARPTAWRRNLSVANSAWTQRILRERHGIAADLLYPPVPQHGPGRPWAARADDFVLLGRIAPEKRVEDAIAILAGVRARGHDVRLRIVGAGEGSYARGLREAAPAWARFEGTLDAPAKAQLLGACRFAISARPQEPFGIALAEAAGAGCIPFAPAGGGQGEVVADPRLLYAAQGDAVAKVCALLEDAPEQERLHGAARASAARFVPGRFREGARRIVGRALAGRHGSEVDAEPAPTPDRAATAEVRP